MEQVHTVRDLENSIASCICRALVREAVHQNVGRLRKKGTLASVSNAMKCYLLIEKALVISQTQTGHKRMRKR